MTKAMTPPAAANLARKIDERYCSSIQPCSKARRHHGQEIMACILLRDGLPYDEAGLRGLCENRVGRHRTPKHFRFADELPRGRLGKVQRLRMLEGVNA